MGADTDSHVLFGLIALQVGLIDQAQLVAAFQASAREKTRPLADHLCVQRSLDADSRAAVEAMAAWHLRKHGGDAVRSLAAIPASRAMREQLAAVGDPELTVTITRSAPWLVRTTHRAHHGRHRWLCDFRRTAIPNPAAPRQGRTGNRFGRHSMSS